MKLSKQKLMQIIKEEMSKALNEGEIDLRDYGVEPEPEPEHLSHKDFYDLLSKAPTIPIDYEDLSSDQQIELGRTAEQMISRFLTISPELRGHLIELVILNLEKIRELEKEPTK